MKTAIQPCRTLAFLDSIHSDIVSLSAGLATAVSMLAFGLSQASGHPLPWFNVMDATHCPTFGGRMLSSMRRHSDVRPDIALYYDSDNCA